MVVTDAWYFLIVVPWLEFSVFSSAPARKFWSSISIRPRPPLQIPSYPVIVSLSTAKLRRQSYIVLSNATEYVCENGGTGPLIPNLSSWWRWMVNFTTRQISPYGNRPRCTVRQRDECASELDTLQKRELSRLCAFSAEDRTF